MLQKIIPKPAVSEELIRTKLWFLVFTPIVIIPPGCHVTILLGPVSTGPRPLSCLLAEPTSKLQTEQDDGSDPEVVAQERSNDCEPRPPPVSPVGFQRIAAPKMAKNSLCNVGSDRDQRVVLIN